MNENEPRSVGAVRQPSAGPSCPNAHLRAGPAVTRGSGEHPETRLGAAAG